MEIDKVYSHINCAKWKWKEWKHKQFCVIQIFVLHIGTSHYVKFRSFSILFIFDSMRVRAETEFQ